MTQSMADGAADLLAKLVDVAGELLLVSVDDESDLQLQLTRRITTTRQLTQCMTRLLSAEPPTGMYEALANIDEMSVTPRCRELTVQARELGCSEGVFRLAFVQLLSAPEFFANPDRSRQFMAKVLAMTAFGHIDLQGLKKFFEEHNDLHNPICDGARLYIMEAVDYKLAISK